MKSMAPDEEFSVAARHMVEPSGSIESRYFFAQRALNSGEALSAFTIKRSLYSRVDERSRCVPEALSPRVRPARSVENRA